ncbi:MAG: SpoIIE family protein phosphatase [Treponema sp.]|jgi:serine phosphatase RsbU (regulator of sigma subunit)|nr:SpoIIE family protein phosphatase [Treponema sp.]
MGASDRLGTRAIPAPLFALFVLFLCAGRVPAQEELYWEAPVPFSVSPGSCPVSASNGEISVVAWQEPEAKPGGDGGEIRIRAAVSTGGNDWRACRPAGGPYRYTGAEPAILGAALGGDGRIVIAAVSAGFCDILVSGDRGETFGSRRLETGGQVSAAPRLALRSDGGYLLFIVRGEGDSQSIYYSRSDDAVNWEPFAPFAADSASRPASSPSHVVLGNADIVVFQSRAAGESAASGFQLYLKKSTDSGRTWTGERPLTGFRYPGSPSDPLRFDNQRPSLVSLEEKLFLAWERRLDSGPPQIYGAEIERDQLRVDSIRRINREESYCTGPAAFGYEGSPFAVWSDEKAGRVFVARYDGLSWLSYELSGGEPSDSELPGNEPSGNGPAFIRPVVSDRGVSLFYQANFRESARIFAMFPDHTVSPPDIIPLNFHAGLRSRGDRVSVTWDDPADTSGIAGYSWLWSQNPGEKPARVLRPEDNVPRVLNLNAAEDGTWYFSVIAQDRAGNWSGPARMDYIRDTSPPPAVTIIPPPADREGFLVSNTFSLNWAPSPVSDISGYVWRLDYLDTGGALWDAAGEQFEWEAAAMFPQIPLLNNLEPRPLLRAAYDNQDDGVWRFTVSAVDLAGNLSVPSRIFFKTNKYVPRTYITLVDSFRDERGILRLRILGRGFSQDGEVGRIFLDQDGMAPYDREYFLSGGDYQIHSDREISGLAVGDIEPDHYQLGLEHPLRGIALSPSPITVDQAGTVKFGDYSITWQPVWEVGEPRSGVAAIRISLIIALAILCFVGIAMSLGGFVQAAADSKAARLEVLALLGGDSMPAEKKTRLAAVKRRGLGLRGKLAGFTIVLVLLVVALVSVPLYYMMTVTQEQTLLRGLRDRSRVLLEGLVTSSKAYLQERNILELSFLPDQISAIPEARYLTITGRGNGDNVFDDHVWATNDPDILSKINTAELQPGVSRLRDILSPRLAEIGAELNLAAGESVGDLSQAVSELTAEGLAIAAATDEESRRRFADIQAIVRSLEARIAETLTALNKEIGSEPAFPTEYLDLRGNRHYVFFKPILYRQGHGDIYFQGLIRLEVSLDSIQNQIAAGQIELLRIILLVALAALGIGTVGALVLSSFIIRPVRRLVEHVERIRDTEDKSKLEGLEIAVTTRDEIAVLGATVNDMTQGLVKAARAASDLSIGKEVQKKFIPLELDKAGNKLSTGFKETDYAEFFGYYEGAKGVSGDYFDYQDLDGRYYAIIKCDVAGKGIPAALIMIQVATMFLNHFKQWKPDEQGFRIEELVYQINDFIETLGFKDRFAAFTLCLFDSHTGVLRFCNAGDNIVHIFNASDGRVKTLALPETPATGVLPNFMVRDGGGYPAVTMTLDRGDILFLYTDGIEEAKRRFRNTEFREILCERGSPGGKHENHMVGQGDEELGPSRVEEIINAVMNRENYTLHKWHNPEGDSDLDFDFTMCRGTVEEVIMALVSVEKMFRCYKNPKAGEDSRVLVDKKLDSFLKTHFVQYRVYCSRTRENAGNDAYMYYTHLNEDEQYDDLTILGIKRKA